MTAAETPPHDPGRAARDAQREQERAASRARQRAAYQRAQRASRDRALRAAAEPADTAQDLPRDLPAPGQTAVELAQQQLEEAELQRALLDALAALPADQRVAVVAALGYAEGPAGAAVELGIEPREAEQLAQEGLDALRQGLSPFVTEDDGPGPGATTR